LYDLGVSLSDASTPQGDRLIVPPGWRQGRGAFGGLVVGSLIRAIEQRIADPARAVRSVTAELPGPIEPGEATVAVDVLRAGHSMTTARASLAQAGEIRSHAVAILAAPRKMAGCVWQDLDPPDAPRWDAVPPLPMAGDPYPEFAANFEYRLVDGMPVSGGTSRCIGWIRAREPGPRRDAAYVAQLVDAWWPAAFVRFTVMRPCATIAFTLDIVADPATIGDAPLLYRGVVPVCGDGYFVETRELWTADGRLVALNHQTFAVIK
jgi:acyl-CoA thioesterase